MRTVFSGVSSNILNKAGLGKIQSGNILTVKIIENKNGLIKAAVKGRILFIKGDSGLKIGNVYRVRAQWSGKTLQLQMLENNENPFKSFGMQTEGPNPDLIFAAARRAGLHLKDSNINLLKRLIRRRDTLTDEKARFASEAVKKGLSPEEMVAVIASGDGEQKSRDEKTKLFNHLTDDNELWFIVPYNFTPDGETGLSGSLRIKKDLISRKIMLVVLETLIDGQRLFFMIDWAAQKNRSVRLFTEGDLSPDKKIKITERLPEILSNLSLNFDDNIIESCFQNNSDGGLFDGFSFSDLPSDGIEEIV